MTENEPRKVCGIARTDKTCNLNTTEGTEFCEYNSTTDRCVFTTNPKSGKKYKRSDIYIDDTAAAASPISADNIIRNLQINDTRSYATVLDSLKCVENDSIIKTTGRIVAIGDIHGDFNVLLLGLYATALIDESGHWIGGNAVLVQTGDIFDDARKHSDGNLYNPSFHTEPVPTNIELHILDYLTNLHNEARVHDGRVILLIGNHEFSAFTDNTNEFSKKYTTKNTQEFYDNDRYSKVKPGTPLAQKLACIYKIGVLVNDFLFCHGGYNIHNIRSVGSLVQMNTTLRNFLVGDSLILDNRRADVFKIIMEHDAGILWDRSSSENYYEPADSNVCKNFENLRKKLKNPNLKMVVGHTIHPRINGVCDYGEGNTIYRIDMGMSRAFKENFVDDSKLVCHVLDIMSDTDIAGIKIKNDTTKSKFKYHVKYFNYQDLIPDIPTYMKSKHYVNMPLLTE